MNTEKPNTRHRILDACISILEEQGGKGVRMGDIAKKTGISRQALYLHFSSRTDLLVASTRHLDEKLDIDARLADSRAAQTGIQRLSSYVKAWGNYIPEIYTVAKPLLIEQDTDQAAEAAWSDRMEAMREGCEAAISALHRDNKLSSEWNTKSATDALWTLLSVRNWEQFTQQCGWSNQQYIDHLICMTNRLFVSP